MKIFLSYPSAHKEIAASINYELQSAGHDVFFDKEDLPRGQSYNERIRGAIEACDLFIFLITPQSVTQGHYTLTELKITSRKWPSPGGRVLPVMLEATPFESIPAYLKAVTILTPEGNATAEILMEVAVLAAAPQSGPKEPTGEDSEIESFSYLPVEIRFGHGSAGTYPVAITASPVGSLAAQPCPLDADALANQLWSAGVAIEGTIRRGSVEIGDDAPGLLPSEEAARRVGETLYKSLFTPQIQTHLQGSLRSVDPQRREGLRFLINTTDAPDLARLPWEFLYDPEQEDFLFSDRMKPVIRWLDVDQPPPKLVIEPPLRLLMAIASPQDRPELSVGAELAHLDEALRDLVDQGRVTTVRLEHATLEKLDDALLTHKPHMLHFIGHGDFAGNDGVIFLEGEKQSTADPITGRRLAVLLRNHLGSLRFVFLNSCLGAAVSRRDPFGGVAQNLIRRGIPAVIAMQFPIPDHVAVSLARHFYRYLAAGLPVDTALTSARAFLFARGHPVEWGAPALHMRTPDGRVFEVNAPGRAADRALRSLPDAEFPPPPKTDAVVASSPPEAPPERALPKAPKPRWIWVVLALLVSLSAFAAIWWSPLGTEKPSSERSNESISTGLRPAAPNGSAPATRTAALESYRTALGALRDNNVEAALGSLKEARQLDSDGAALADSPAIRQALFDELLGLARKELKAGNIDVAREAASALQLIDKNRAASELRKLFPTAAPESTAATRTYRVRRGDTLWNIASARYGDPLQWRRIYHANRERVRDPHLIYPNQELLLPAGSTPEAPLRYRVKTGDTLWDVAGSIYDNPTLWRRIYDANRDRIEDPNSIAPKQEILIPRAAP